MTERDIEKVLIARGLPEYCRTGELGRVLGISFNSVKKALDEGKLPRAARGFVTRSAVAIWLSSREDLIAQMMSKPAPAKASAGEVIVPWWRDDCITITTTR